MANYVSPYDIPPLEYASEKFAKDNLEGFDEYIGFRIAGHSPSVAFCRAFRVPQEHNANNYTIACAIEANPYIRRGIESALEKMDAKKVWTSSRAVWELMQLVVNQMNRESTRLAAIKELNVLAGITIIDPNGKTKIPTLQDFYASQASGTEEQKAQ